MSLSTDADRVLNGLLQNQKELASLLSEARKLNLETTLHFFYENLYQPDTRIDVTKAYVGVPSIRLVLSK